MKSVGKKQTNEKERKRHDMTNNNRSVRMVDALKVFVEAGHLIESVDFGTGVVVLKVDFGDQRDAQVITRFRDTNSVIEAIKLYRSLYNVGLADAKNATEALLQHHGLR